MATRPKIKVTKEGPTGLNQKFKVNGTTGEVSRPKLIKEVKAGKHPNYHIRNNGRVEYVASNPNGKKNDNLG